MSFAQTVAAIIAATASFGAVMGKVWRTATKVARWVDSQEVRYQAVDVVVGDWAERGLTAAGAVREGKRYRDTVDGHTSAIADHKARLDDHEERLLRSEQVNAHIGQRLDEIADTIHKAG